MKERLELVQPTASLKKSFYAMAEGFRAPGEQHYSHYREVLEKGESLDFAAYVKELQENSQGINLRPGLVAMTTFWLVRDGETIVSVSRLRHCLTPYLLKHGGHIGYETPPNERRKGYATKVLALTLLEARKLGIQRVLVTCDPKNVASAKVIQKNGGKLENEIVVEVDGKPRPTSRYWIENGGKS
jgi:predicted acetyltransferase